MIRPALPSDIPVLVALWEQISLDEFAAQIGRDNVLGFINSGALKEDTEDQIGSTYVAERGGEICGFVVILGELIELLLVAPQRRSGFVAKALYSFAIRQIAQDHRQVRAECFEKNAKANSLLQRLGFAEELRYPDDLGFTTVRYVKPLT